MSLGNKSLRDHAIPFVSNPVEITGDDYGYYRFTTPEFMTDGNFTVAIPMTRPEKGDVVEAYLFMELVAPSDKSLEIYLGIGTFTTVDAELSMIPETSYTDGYIKDQHRNITGLEDPLSVAANGTLFVDADLTRALDHRGDATFLPDAFCLLITFVDKPSSENGYSVDKFKLQCTAQMGFGT